MSEEVVDLDKATNEKVGEVTPQENIEIESKTPEVKTTEEITPNPEIAVAAKVEPKKVRPSLRSPEDDPGSASCFKNEGKIAYFWLLYTLIYWTICIWTKVLITKHYLRLSLLVWAIACTIIIGNCFSIKSGHYPSGATLANPNASSLKGRLATFSLTCIISLDLVFLAIIGISSGASGTDLARGTCHFTSLIFSTFFFFNRFYKSNPDIAKQSFFCEWLDIFLSIFVILFLNYTYYKKTHNTECFKLRLCSVYSIVLIFQLIGWIWPMQLIRQWGIKPYAPKVAMHLLIIDLLTNLPLIIAILVMPNASYRKYIIIWIDFLYKTFGLMQSIAYNSVFYIWLKKGNKTDESVKLTVDTQENVSLLS